jgi:hypothetical protein
MALFSNVVLPRSTVVLEATRERQVSLSNKVQVPFFSFFGRLFTIFPLLLTRVFTGTLIDEATNSC